MDSDLEIVQLVRDAQAGSIDGLTSLYEMYTGRVWQHIHRRSGGNRALTDDIHGDVWETVQRKIGTFKPEKGVFIAWVFGIADNHAISLARRAGVNRTNRELRAHMLTYGASEASRDLGPEDAAVASAEAEHLLSLVRALPGRQREAILLTEYDGLSPAEAAAVLGCSAGTVSMARHKALVKLRQKLGVDHPGKNRRGLRVEVVVANAATVPDPAKGHAERTLEG